MARTDEAQELNVIADEAYELLRLKLEEKQALEEVALLDDLMILQGAQIKLAKGKQAEMADTWREALPACLRVLTRKGKSFKIPLTTE